MERKGTCTRYDEERTGSTGRISGVGPVNGEEDLIRGCSNKSCVNLNAAGLNGRREFTSWAKTPERRGFREKSEFPLRPQ